METHLLIDWLTVSFKVSSEQFECFFDFLVRLLSFPLNEAIKDTSYLSGYAYMYFYQSITIHCRSNEICINASGSGCRMIEELNKEWDWLRFFKMFYPFVVNKDKSTGVYLVHFSRIDYAFDLLNDDRITLPFLQRYVLEKKFVCKSEEYENRIGNKKLGIYFGSGSSDRLLRIYDKAMEQKIKDKHWVRFEFQLRNESATSLVLALTNNVSNYGKVFFGMMHDYLRFVTSENTGVHQVRLTTCRWWLNLLQGIEPMSQLYIPGASYGLSNVSKFYVRGCASTVRTLLEANGGDITELLTTAANTPMNKRQKMALERYLKAGEL